MSSIANSATEIPIGVSVVVPAYRDAESVEPLARALHDVLGQRNETYEILFVVDACPAGSWEAVLRAAADNPNVRAIRLARNCGQNWAALVGLHRARGRLLVVMDADLQDPPAALPALLNEIARGHDVVFAGRRGAYQSPVRRLTSRLFKGVLHLASGGVLPADAGLFLVLTAHVRDALGATRPGRPHTVALIGRGSWRTCSIPVVRSQSHRGQSGYRGLSRLWLGLGALDCLLLPDWFAGWILGRRKVGETVNQHLREIVQEWPVRPVP